MVKDQKSRTLSRKPWHSRTSHSTSLCHGCDPAALHRTAIMSESMSEKEARAGTTEKMCQVAEGEDEGHGRDIR